MQFSHVPATASFWPLILLCAAAAGCSHRPSADEMLDASLARMGKSRETVYPLAGRVTIDGHPPQLGPRQKILVLLDRPPDAKAPRAGRPFVVCNDRGEFAFHTYREGDGVPPGDYVLTFVELVDRGKRGYAGPDGLKNLYSDPDKSEFHIAHKEGQTDYTFDLKIAGRDGANASPKALRTIEELTGGR